MTNKADEHQRLIPEQFTKQAVPFSQMQNHSPELLLTATGAGPADTVLDARGRGVGARLLCAARDHAVRTGAARLALSTAITNTKAQALYERDGWRRDTAFYHYEYELPKGGG